MELIIPFVLLFGLLALGVPVAFSLGIAGTVGLFLTLGFEPAVTMLATAPFSSGTTFLLTTVPTFVLMAEFLSAGTLSKTLYEAAYVWLGRLRGGLAAATTLASAGMGAMTGSSSATAATFSAVAIPHMRRHGYDDKLSAGSIAAAGTLASIIPPSIALIIYGVATETSIGDLFAAGVIPGLITTAVYIATIYIWVRLKPSIAPHAPEKVPLKHRLIALRRTLPALLLIVIVLGGIYSGIVTPTEAGALGAAGALVLSVIFGGLRLSGIMTAVTRALGSTAMIISIVIFANVFGYWLTTSRIAQMLLSAISESALPGWVVMLFIVLLYLILGTFMDQIAILVLTLPLTFPIVMELGYNPIWFGILVIKLGEIGLVSPPVGLNVFVTAGSVKDLKLGDAFKGVVPFIIAELLLVILWFAVPEVMTWLPSVLDTKG